MRADIAQIISVMDPTTLRHAGATLAENFASWFKHQRPIKKVALFHAMSDEIAMSPLDNFLEHHAIERFFAKNKAKLGPSIKHFDASLAEDMDLIIVPGRAFDRQGNRLGRGGGYYDQLLSPLFLLKKRPILMGVGLSEQIVPLVPCEAHDVKMDIILTPEEIITAIASE